MKIRKIAMMAVLIGATAAVCILTARAGETKTATATTAAGVTMTFGPQQTESLVVDSVNYSCDATLGKATFYQRTTAGAYVPSSTPTNGATNILCKNTGVAITNGDHVVYAHANGTILKTTCSGSDATNVVLAAGLTVAGAAGDRLYDMEVGGYLPMGVNTTYAGTNAIGHAEGKVFVTRRDSPLYVTMDTQTNASLTVVVSP